MSNIVKMSFSCIVTYTNIQVQKWNIGNNIRSRPGMNVKAGYLIIIYQEVILLFIGVQIKISLKNCHNFWGSSTALSMNPIQIDNF